MKANISLKGAFLAILICALVAPCVQAEITVNLISMRDVTPPQFSLDESWESIGHDHNDNVYYAVSSRYGSNGIDDVCVFRYHTVTGEKTFLGNLRGVSAAVGNLGPNQHWPEAEGMAKVHSHIIEYNGKMYFSTHDYHNIKSDYSDMFDHRGGHFYAFDLATETMEDLSVTETKGVSVEHQSIIAIDVLRAEQKLVGWTFPLGDVLLYDLNSGKTTRYPGVPEYKMRNVSRQIIAGNNGKVYFSYDTDNFWLWELDTKTGVMKRTDKPNILQDGSVVGSDRTKNRKMIYLQGYDGFLHRFNLETEELEQLGFFIPQEEVNQGYMVTRSAGPVLSPDETKLYSIPFARSGGPNRTLYEYDLLTGESIPIADLSSELRGIYLTGSGVMDSQGKIYFTGHYYGAQSEDQAKLVQIDISERFQEIPKADIESNKITAAVVLDGKLLERAWSAADSISFSNLARGDNTVKVLTLWDDTNLYFAYEVADAHLEAVHGGLWADDGVEIYLDTNNEKTPSMDSNDYQFIINIHDVNTDPGISSKTAVVPGGGYIMEIAIPWSVISTTPSVNKVMGLLLANNDRDNSGNLQFDWLGLIESGSYKRPNLWGNLKLVQPNIPSSPLPPQNLRVLVVE